MLLIGGLGGACVLVTAVLPDFALVFAGGREYEEVERPAVGVRAARARAWRILQLLVYSVLARQGKALDGAGRGWRFGVVVVAAATTVSTCRGLLAVVLTVELVLLGGAACPSASSSCRERAAAQ